jgi:hypothetical protein
VDAVMVTARFSKLHMELEKALGRNGDLIEYPTFSGELIII